VEEREDRTALNILRVHESTTANSPSMEEAIPLAVALDKNGIVLMLSQNQKVSFLIIVYRARDSHRDEWNQRR
jgi:hypothetical protein